ncbi:hypothetical protein WG908_15760 [Sphingobium sp. AN641]|uniref:hypothetical protein n=1 Tax=Sphingobium sp. AN641 TaxID=3133443 RepID=UPI0030BE2CEF
MALVVSCSVPAGTAQPDIDVAHPFGSYTRRVFERPPSVSLSAFLEVLSEKRADNPNSNDYFLSINDKLRSSTELRWNGAVVSSYADIGTFHCSDDSDLNVKELTAKLCVGARTLERIVLQGEVQLSKSEHGNIDPLSARQYLYYASQIHTDIAALNLDMVEVTSQFVERWNGHFGFPFQIFVINISVNVIAVVQSENESYSVNAYPAIRKISIYIRRED